MLQGGIITTRSPTKPKLFRENPKYSRYKERSPLTLGLCLILPIKLIITDIEVPVIMRQTLWVELVEYVF